MGFLDKFDKEKFKSIANTVGEKAKEVSKSTSDALKEASEKNKEISAKSKELKQPVEGAIIRYAVIYLGGLAELNTKKSGEIGLNVLDESFYLKPTSSSIEWFEEMSIPYNKIKKFEITTRTLSTSELLLTSDAKGLQTDNNIEITYINNDDKTVLLRLEMLTGITVAGQAMKCKEMMDLLRSESILDKFDVEGNKPIVQQDDVITQIKKLNELKELGLISEDEFNSKKSELLKKI